MKGYYTMQQPYTRINNALLNALCKTPLSGQELRVLLFIIRYTLGFNRDTAELSITYIANGTEISTRNVRRILTHLEELGFINLSHTQGTKPRRITFREDKIAHTRGDKNAHPREDKIAHQEIKENKENAQGSTPGGLTQREKEIIAALNAEWVPNEF